MLTKTRPLPRSRAHISGRECRQHGPNCQALVNNYVNRVLKPAIQVGLTFKDGTEARQAAEDLATSVLGIADSSISTATASTIENLMRFGDINSAQMIYNGIISQYNTCVTNAMGNTAACGSADAFKAGARDQAYRYLYNKSLRTGTDLTRLSSDLAQATGVQDFIAQNQSSYLTPVNNALNLLGPQNQVATTPSVIGTDLANLAANGNIGGQPVVGSLGVNGSGRPVGVVLPGQLKGAPQNIPGLTGMMQIPNLPGVPQGVNNGSGAVNPTFALPGSPNNSPLIPLSPTASMTN